MRSFLDRAFLDPLKQIVDADPLVLATPFALSRQSLSVYSGSRIVRPTTREEFVTLYRTRGSYVVQELDWTSTSVAALCNKISVAVMKQVKAAAYVSLPESSFLPRHTDDADVLAVQVVGEKVFNVRDEEVRLRAGDALLIPEGAEHSTRAATLSVHLCIAMRPIERATRA